MSNLYQEISRTFRYRTQVSNARVTVFDTLAGSLGHGLQIIRAAELAGQGHTMEEIVEELIAYRDKMNILVLLDTLENIVKGGRLSKFQGPIATIFNMSFGFHL